MIDLLSLLKATNKTYLFFIFIDEGANKRGQNRGSSLQPFMEDPLF